MNCPSTCGVGSNVILFSEQLLRGFKKSMENREEPESAEQPAVCLEVVIRWWSAWYGATSYFPQCYFTLSFILLTLC
jgi:hypothetical protein